MNTLILEIGSYSIRAAISKDGKTTPMLISSYTHPDSLPSVCTKLPNSGYIWGEAAKQWIGYKGCLTYDLAILEKLNNYPKAVADLIAELMNKNDVTDAIMFVIPAYWTEKEPKKGLLIQAAKDCGIDRVDFITVPVACCNKAANANLSDNEYMLFYDAGFMGASVSLLQRQHDKIVLVDSVLVEEAGGQNYDNLILQNINDKTGRAIENDYERMLYLSDLHEKAVFVKERLSSINECRIPVEKGERIFALTAYEWQTMIAPSLGKSFQACSQILQDNNVEAGNLNQILLYGGTCNIPCIAEMLLDYAKAQFGNTVMIYNLSFRTDSAVLPLLGAGIEVQEKEISF